MYSYNTYLFFQHLWEEAEFQSHIWKETKSNNISVDFNKIRSHSVRQISGIIYFIYPSQAQDTYFSLFFV